MKCLNSKDAGKMDEKAIMDIVTEHMKNVFQHYIGEPLSEEDIDRMNKKAKEILENLWNQPLKFTIKPPKPANYIMLDFNVKDISMGCHVAPQKCLLCGANCPEGDCQLGVE